MSVVLKMMCVLLCAVFVSAEVMPMTDFDLEKMSGKWYIIGMATNAEWFVSHKANMKMGTAMLVPTEDGDLDISLATLQDDGSCWRASHLAKKTETLGRWENDNDMRVVVDARFDEYAFIHTIKTKEGVSELLNALFSRNTTVAEDVVEKFRKFSLDIGFLEEDILILPPNGECKT
ncbi:lipocalin-like isoform X3 [Triplophysa rosa]|uniref:lipocalin-like isoform X3 n=1 Tax=Triplophysa rosa TaxID=992332 RepID=UPI002545DCD6|nr:lipocalin-like isoform X3 [Triplophysa rosa]